MDSSIKSLTITGAAAEDATRSRQKAAGSRKKRYTANEDDFIEEVKNFHAKVEPKLEPKVEVKLEPKVEIKHIQRTEDTQVILKPPRHPRVKLQPKLAQPIKSAETNTTRKARRIFLHSGNLTHRFTRAKKVKDETEKKSIDAIRTFLVEKGVIQLKSKAPEKMLRSMYADFMLLKDQAL